MTNRQIERDTPTQTGAGARARRRRLTAGTTHLIAGVLLLLSQAAQAVTYPFVDTMEGVANFTPSGSWALSGEQVHGAAQAWSDSPGTSYVNNSDSSLTLSSAVDLTAAVAPQLLFWHKLEVESEFDFASVEYSINGGTSWAGLAQFTGVHGWRRQQLDLSAFVGQSLLLRFRLTSDKSVVGDGWYIDDLVISEPLNPVTSLTVGNSTRSTLDLNWTRNQDAAFNYYAIYRSRTAGVTTADTLVATITDPAVVSYVDSGLFANTNYYYRIYTVDTNLIHSPGKEVMGTTIASTNYPLSDDMESATNHWTADAPWATMSVTYNTITTTAWSDSPAGSYAPGTDASLMISLDLGNATMPVIAFDQKYSFEVDSDFGFVEVREEGSATWQRIYAITGAQAAWANERIDLTLYAGKKIDLRYRVVADSNGTQSDGWYIDNVTLGETTIAPISYPLSDTMEVGSNNWHTSSWKLDPLSHEGSFALTDSPAGNYAPLTSSSLILANTIDLTNSTLPILTFWHKYDLRNCPYASNTGGCSYYDGDYDYGRIYVSSYYGHPGTWQEVAAFTGTSDWTYHNIDLSSWQGLPNVRIKFVMTDTGPSSGSVNYLAGGWSLDQISIEDAPQDVALSITASTSNSVGLSWTQNNDVDFSRYEIYRSATPGVTRASTLVASISNQATTSYTDPVSINQPGTYYYRVWVIDTVNNVPPGSNEVVATYNVPLNNLTLNGGVLSFVEDGESGTAQWAWGSPWGLSNVTPFSGVSSWTDSPGSNYAANANTSLMTFVNLNGTSTPVLSFQHRYSLEFAKDFVYLEVSTDNGASWTALRSFTGSESLWNMERVDLTPYAGHAGLGIRFRLTSDGVNQQDGYYLDNLLIQEEPVAALYPLNDNVESGAGAWTWSSTWGITAADPGSVGHAWNDSPEGAYAPGTDSWLMTSIDLNTATLPVLYFSHKYAFEVDSDFGYVEVKEVGSTAWTRLMFVTGTAAVWTPVALDLTQYAGRQINLRFHLVADNNGTQSDGWYLDDIRIQETTAATLTFPYIQNFEGAVSDSWHTGSWQQSADTFAGSFALTDSLEGNYGALTQSAVVMANTIDLTGTSNPMLSFQHKYDLRNCPYASNTGGCPYYDSDYDYARVYVSSFNGQSGTWTQLASFTGSSAWQYTQLDLTPWKGLPNVRIKFVVEDSGPANGSINYLMGGWSIDDLTIEENPVDVVLNMVSSNQRQIQLGWNNNNDPDFLRYEIYRSTTPGVTRANTLVGSITDPLTTNLTDPVALILPGTYYYRLWVVDSNGNLSLGSNEVVASYADTIPYVTGLGFVEGGEAGTGSWSWGEPWGLTNATPHTGSFAWTDSPGANYAANSNTSMVTFLDLSGSIHPVLTFWQHYSLEQGKDFVYLEVSTNDGQSWTQLRAITGTETTWNRERVDLTAYAGNARLGLRFRLVTDGANQADGFHFDDMTIAEEPVSATYPFVDDNEAGIVPWLYDSPWGRTTAEFHTGSFSWTDSPFGAYAPGTDSSLYLTIDLGTAVMPVLTFWQRYAFDPNSDYGYVEVRELGSTSWQRIYFVTGAAASWGYETLDLANYAGKQIQLRFRLVADNNGIQSDGWYIDDLQIGETTNAPLSYPLDEGLEAGDSSWFTGSWSLTADPQSGSFGITDSIEGNYGALTQSSLIMASTIDLSAAVHPLLSFWHKYSTRNCPYASNTGGCSYYDADYDYARVFLSTYNGQPGTWVQIASFNGVQAAYGYHEIDLSSWRGLSNVRIKFVMEDTGPSSGSVNYTQSGWSLDTIRVGENLNIPTTIIVSSGDQQSGVAGQPLTQPLVALVRDSSGNPVGGIGVDFAVTGGDGSVNPITAISDAAGYVSTVLTLGTTLGTNSVSATISTSTESAAFTATGYSAAQPVYLRQVSGGQQVGEVNTTLNNPLSVQVTDVGSNASSGVSVIFAVAGGDVLLADGAAGSTTLPVTTDVNGIASVNVLLGATTGASTITASSLGLDGSPISFNAYTVLPGGTLGDTDGDGLPDLWESNNGLDPLNAADATGDPDNDTLNNLQEFASKSNPQSSDTDGDGMPDAWEVLYGLNPASSGDALLDSDGDGVNNAQEYLDGTIPTRLNHFSLGTTSNSWMDLYGSVSIDGIPSAPGDEVAVYDADGVLCGHFVVESTGNFGFLHVYADDPNTATDEGASLNDLLSFRLWDVSAQVELSASPSQLVSWSGDQQSLQTNLSGAAAYSIPLQQGWNLISFPVKTVYYVGTQPIEPVLPGSSYQPVTSLAEVLASVAGKVEYIRGFDSQGAKSYDPLLPQFSDLNYLAGGYGYWIKMNAPGNLVVSGVRAQRGDTLALNGGWNLVGYWHTHMQYVGTQPVVSLPAEVTSFTQVATIHQIVQSLGSDYQVIRSFDSSGAHTYDPALGNFNDLNYLAPGYGLWIKLAVPATLNY